MSSIRIAMMSVVIGSAVAATALAPTFSLAQTTSQPQSSPTQSTGKSMSDTIKSTAEDVSKWTQKQWDEAKAKWAKEKDKWESCNKKASDQKLEGRNSWSFLYTCMTG